MYIYAQILNGKVHCVMEHQADITELYEKYYARTIEFIDITNLSPVPTVGMLYDGSGFSTYVEPELPLEETKANKISEMKAKRDTLEMSGFTYLDKTFDSNAIAVQRLSVACLTAVSAVLVGQSFSVEWTCADNSTILLTAQQLLGLPPAMAQYSNSLHERYRVLKEQINLCTTNAEVEAIVWDI